MKTYKERWQEKKMMLLYKTDPWSGIKAWSGEGIYWS